MGGDGREDVASVECLADGGQKILRIRDGADFVFSFRQDEREDAVIGTDEKLSGGFDQDGAAQRADARIDYHDVHGSGRKMSPRLGDGEGGFGDIEGAAFMRDIDDVRLGADPENDALHDAGVVIGETEVGGQGDDGVWFGWRRHLRTILVPVHEKPDRLSRFFKRLLQNQQVGFKKTGKFPVFALASDSGSMLSLL